ncbi:MAG TPA: flagellar brake protein [Lachnospiraceae bacterium]|nr:flagellar brake protein [Lachnospiraceae bacterium]
MLTDLVRPGEKVEIEAAEQAIMGSSKEKKKIYYTKVYDILDDEKLEVLMPMEGTKLVLLPVDGEFRFCFYTKKGLYQCFIRVVERYKSNNVFILLCEVTSPLSKHQRREYYRYATALNIQTRELLPEEEKLVDEGKFHAQMGLPLSKGMTADISGGGVRFLSKEQYKPDSHIYIEFNLVIGNKEQTYALVGLVLQSKASEVRDGEFEHRVKFVVIDSVQREEIIRYIFDEERKNRRRMTGIGL